MDYILVSLISGIVGLVSGISLSFGQGWSQEWFRNREKKQNSIEKFMAKVTDIIAISTSSGYSNRQNEAERRTLSRAAFQLERLGEVELAYNIRDYTNKWREVYDIITDPHVKPYSSDDEKRRLGLIGKLDVLTSKILRT